MQPVRFAADPSTVAPFHPLRQMARVAALVSALAGSALPLTAAAGGHVLAGNTPRIVTESIDLGAEDPAAPMRLTFWLKSPLNGAAADAVVETLYDPASPSYHRWMGADNGSALLASSAQAATVADFARSHQLKVVSTAADSLAVTAEGSVAQVQQALQVQIHRYSHQGRTYRANSADPIIEGPAGELVASVAGLAQHQAHPHAVRPLDPETGTAQAAVPLAVLPEGAFFSAQCFRSPEVDTFNTSGGLPSATYAGNRYGQDITNSANGTLPPCGYQPSDLHGAYGMNDLYLQGRDGTGQTVVIVDAIGSPTIAQDAEIFSQVYGLPDLTPANFTVYYPGGQPAAPDLGWADETTLDVETVHAMAPGAHIALVVAPTSNDSDLQAAVLYALQHHLGNVVSNSYGAAEADNPTSNLDAWNNLARLAASQGVSVNFSSGDGGDTNPSGSTGLPVFGVNSPADSPWATAVGGTSMSVNAQGNLAFQTGWGNNITRVVGPVAAGSLPDVPPLSLGFTGGAGGGSSVYFGKPAFQSRLPGRARLVPDIAFLADPYTGVEIICDGASCFGDPPGAELAVFGGTSLASPMFSAVWAIANQAAGAPLGQAARLLYRLPAGAISDVTAVGSLTNVRGVIATSSGLTFESANALAAPLDGTRAFVSALYNSPYSTKWYVLTFGTDSSLTTGPGWDNVTGLGTPNGKSFVDAVVNAH